MQYNRAKKFNTKTGEIPNQLAIVEAENDYYSASYLLGGVDPVSRTPFRYVNFADSSTDLLIEVCSKSEIGDKSILVVSIHLETQESRCAGESTPPPIVAPSEQRPTSPPRENNGVCDDDREGTFYSPAVNRDVPCTWLATRPAQRATLCTEDDPSGARWICQETCGVCNDECFDSNEDTFTDDNGRQRKCLWLSRRNDKQDILCQPGKDAYTTCGETCNSCDGGLYDGAPALAFAPASKPVSAPVAKVHNMEVVCDDSREGTFYVESTTRYEPCIWLAARPTYQSIFCQEGHPAGARDVCPETCGKCRDECTDDSTGTFDDRWSERDCTWLSLRNREQGRLCTPGHEAYTKCPETCNVCDGIEL